MSGYSSPEGWNCCTTRLIFYCKLFFMSNGSSISAARSCVSPPRAMVAAAMDAGTSSRLNIVRLLVLSVSPPLHRNPNARVREINGPHAWFSL